MIEAFKWRKSFGVNSFDPLSVPKEFYLVAGFLLYLPAKDGTETLYFRGKVHRKIDILEPHIKNLLVNCIDRVDAAAGKEFGWTIILDCRGTGYENLDLHMLLFVLSFPRKYYPNGCKTVLVYGLPWILNWFANLAIKFIPQETMNKIKFINTFDQLLEYVDEDNIPDFLGGKAIKNYYAVPEGARPAITFAADYGLTEEQIIKMIKPSLEHINIGEERYKLEHF